ncbi:hypothetical protein BGP77_17275 [Saccharospirillum sp. MSK14-1]|nr:hypothetical protein BGP77_17275 [Saccharospirillum sp. MSK14-1]
MVVVAVFQEDLTEGAVAQAQCAFAIGVVYLHCAADMIAIEEQVARVGAAHAAGFKFPAIRFVQFLMQDLVVGQPILFDTCSRQCSTSGIHAVVHRQAGQ